LLSASYSLAYLADDWRSKKAVKNDYPPKSLPLKGPYLTRIHRCPCTRIWQLTKLSAKLWRSCIFFAGEEAGERNQPALKMHESVMSRVVATRALWRMVEGDPITGQVRLGVGAFELAMRFVNQQPGFFTRARCVLRPPWAVASYPVRSRLKGRLWEQRLTWFERFNS